MASVKDTIDTQESTELKMLDTPRVFVCVKEPNTRFLVYEEKNDERNKPYVTLEGGVITPTVRYGDVYAQFSDGLCTTNDPRVVVYCESRFPLICDFERADHAAIIEVARHRVPRNNFEPTEANNDVVAQMAKVQEGAMEAELNRRLAAKLAEMGIEMPEEGSEGS